MGDDVIRLAAVAARWTGHDLDFMTGARAVRQLWQLTPPWRALQDAPTPNAVREGDGGSSAAVTADAAVILRARERQRAVPGLSQDAALGSGWRAGYLTSLSLALPSPVVRVEAHELPAGPEPRIGVPQAVHIHWLQTGGAEAVEALLPGSTGLLLAAGAHRIPVTTNMVIQSPEGWYRRWQRATHHVITASRDLTDFVIREQVLKDPRVSVRTQTKAVGLLGDRHTVTGVRVQDSGGTEAEVRADLIIDACGRATRMPQWLKGLGISSLTEERVDSGLAYASRIYRAPVPTRGWPVVGVQADPRLPGPGKAGGILPIEGDRWHVSLMGAPGGHSTREAEAFEPFARTLLHPVLADLLKHAEPLTGVSVTRSTENRRYYYERLRHWPEGLVVLGDSVAAFNPVQRAADGPHGPP